jgi:CubicO group peptidase (beta-lactamase class C family)
MKDTLSVSSLGFAERRIAIARFSPGKPSTIYLAEKSKVLPTVIVDAEKKRRRTFDLGNKMVRGGTLENDTAQAGRAIALLIDSRDPKLQRVNVFPAYLEKAQLRIFRNNLASFKFRVRINDVDNLTGGPGKELLGESIVVESSMRKGWLVFDLSHLNYEVSKPFFITFEQITTLQDRMAIAEGFRDYITKNPRKLKSDSVEFEGEKYLRQVLAGGIDLPGTFIAMSNTESRLRYYSCYGRESSFDEWKRASSIVTATVTLSNNLNDSMAINPGSCSEADAACKAEQICRDFVDESGLAGMQVAVSKNGKLVWSANKGYADLGNKIKVTDSTLFRINSISKSVTSLALMKLVGEGKLDLDVPVQNYVSSFPVKDSPITIRQLAGHLAGFRDYNEDDLSDYIRTEHFTTATAALKIFKDDTLLFKPGARFSYSTFGWNLIGAAIEGASGEPYLQYMAENVWKPLKLQHTFGDDRTRKYANRSKFYDATGAENELGDISYKYAGGGLLSTTSDLVRIGNEILFGSYIDPKLKATFFNSQYTSDNKPTGYGLGWYIGRDKNNHRIWYHGGDSFSGSSYLLIYPDDGIVLSFLANGQEGTSFNVQEIGELFYKK